MLSRFLEWCGYPTVKKKFVNMFSRFDAIPPCDGQTRRQMDNNRQTSCDSIVRAMHGIAR